MKLPKITKKYIRDCATKQSYERGEDYYEYGAVASVVRRGNLIIAEVEGSEYEPYTVTITFDENHIQQEYCTCPYDWGGICKHIVAVLLTLKSSRSVPTCAEPKELLDKIIKVTSFKTPLLT